MTIAFLRELQEKAALAQDAESRERCAAVAIASQLIRHAKPEEVVAEFERLAAQFPYDRELWLLCAEHVRKAVVIEDACTRALLIPADKAAAA